MEQWRIIEVYCCINRLQQLFQIMLKEGIYSLLSQQQEPRIINILLLFFEIQQWVIFYVPPWSRHLSHTKFHIHVLPLENSPRTRIRRNILNDENRPFLGCFCFFVKALLKSEFFSLKTSTIDPVVHVQLFKIHELTNQSIPNLYLRSLKFIGGRIKQPNVGRLPSSVNIWSRKHWWCSEWRSWRHYIKYKVQLYLSAPV